MLERTALTSALLALAALSASAQEGPPGLVLVKGGRTKIGSDVKAIEKYIIENRKLANTFAGETPEHTVEVEDFYLMPTEVTNDQYSEFVRATGAKPPYYWGEQAIEDARREHVNSEGLKIKEARDKGETYTAIKFDPAEWWDDNWEECEWEVPSARIEEPVNFVSYYDAEAYCEWTGLRLMTEFEHQRAARGNGSNVFPWGNKFEVEACNSLLNEQKDGPMPVGSFPEGAVNGIYDLVGNVWEWTQSPYTRFPGYEPFKINDGREVIEGLASFSLDSRVLAGGSYVQTDDGCRISVRCPAERRQATEGVGFRCASDVNPGTQPAEWVLKRRIRKSSLSGDTNIDFDPAGTAILQKWQTREGGTKVEGYAVITGVERVLFTPVEQLDASGTSDLAKNTVDHPAYLGVMTFEFGNSLMQPQLDAGTYVLGFRGAEKLRGDMAEAFKNRDDPVAVSAALGNQTTTAFWQLDGFDPERDFYFLYRPDGEPVLALPAAEPSFEKLRGPSYLRFEKFVPPTEEELEAMDEDAPPIIPMDTLRLRLHIPGKRSNKGLVADMQFGLEPGTMDESWK